MYEKDSYHISVGTRKYPGSLIAIRIDDNEPFRAFEKDNFKGEEALKIINQLKIAKQITTRYTKFPSPGSTDDTFEVYGFNEAFQYINWAFSKIK